MAGMQPSFVRLLFKPTVPGTETRQIPLHLLYSREGLDSYATDSD